MTSKQATLVDENEQLRVALEAALEINAQQAADLDRSRQSLASLARENRETIASHAARSATELDSAAEELRNANEELHTLAMELEVSNVNLHGINQELDARVIARTDDLSDMMLALRSLADLVPDLLWRTDTAGQADWFNERWYTQTGQEDDSSFGMGWLDTLRPDQRGEAIDRWASAIALGTPYVGEHLLRGADGNYRWFLVRAEPARGPDGEIAHWFAAGTDIDDQRVALEALQRSELRFRTLVEGMPQLIWRAVDGGRWTWASTQWTDYTGQSHDESLALGWLAAIHPDDRATGIAEWAQADAGQGFDMEARIFHAIEGQYRHFRVRALPARKTDGELLEWIGTCTDVDDMLKLQEQQSVLVAELQHRTRNLMAIVQAITMRTLKTSRDLDHFRACIDDRLQALARVQGLLSRREGATRVPLDLLIRAELSAHVEIDGLGRGQQLTIAGPSGVTLRSATVQTLALAVHELATNAIKYGAFAFPTGHLAISWGLTPAGDGEKLLTIDWRETGVTLPPDAELSSRRSYGRELIERALPYQLGAKTRYGFEADGVHCTIEVGVPINDSGGEEQA